MKQISSIKAAYNIKKIIENYSNKEKLKIHSIFNKVINIEIDNRLICIGYNADTISPFGAIVDEADFDYLVNTINANTVIVLKDFNFIFDNKISLRISPPIEFHTLGFNNVSINRKKLEKNIKFLKSIVKINNWQCGLEWDFNSIIDVIEGRNNLEALKEFDEKLNCVCSIKNIEEKSCSEFLDYFIGRGKGLTPSGDDLIVGMIGMYSCANVNIENFITTLKRFLEENSHKTTRISYEYLFYAHEKQVSTSLKRLCLSILYKDEKEILENVVCIKKFGSTSPIDMIIGVIIAGYFLMEG